MAIFWGFLNVLFSPLSKRVAVFELSSAVCYHLCLKNAKFSDRALCGDDL